MQIISPTAHQCSTNINNSRKRCQPMQKARREYHKKMFEWIKELKGEHIVNICELKKMHSGRNITYECCVSQSVLYEVFHSAIRLWFMISEKKYHKVHVSSPWCMHAPKSL